jgi:hypothetical protein
MEIGMLPIRSATASGTLRQGGCRLPARLITGTEEERLEQFGELSHLGLARDAKAFEAGDSRHQHDVLQPPRLRPFQLTKPVRHDKSLHAKYDAIADGSERHTSLEIN